MTDQQLTAFLARVNAQYDTYERERARQKAR